MLDFKHNNNVYYYFFLVFDKINVLLYVVICTEQFIAVAFKHIMSVVMCS